jgi:hypothetical protein
MTSGNPNKSATPMTDKPKEPMSSGSSTHQSSTGHTNPSNPTNANNPSSSMNSGNSSGASSGCASGAVAGSNAHKMNSQTVNPSVESQYWKDNYSKRPYADAKVTQDDFAPAYRYGWESFASHGGDEKTFDTVEPDLRRGWEKAKGSSQLGWEQAKAASRDAWDRVDGANRGDNTNRADNANRNPSNSK